MANHTVTDLLDGQVLQFNALATVLHDCVVIRDNARLSHTIIGFSQLSGMKKVRTSRPALLVISAGLFLISAAAFCSKDGSGAGVPVSVAGCTFAVGYWLSRRASIAFVAGSDTTETTSGSPSEAAALASAVQLAQHRLLACE